MFGLKFAGIIPFFYANFHLYYVMVCSIFFS